MKKHIAVLMALISICATQADEQRGSINLKGVSVSQTLTLYSHFTDKKLIIEPGATNQWKHIDLQIQSATKQETAKLFEKALREQANVVITPLDDKRASVKLVKK